MSYTQGLGPVLGYAALSGLGCVCSYFERDLHCFWKNNAKTLRFENFAYINYAIYNGRLIMPLSTSALFADRTMLRSIFMALEVMALFSDACLFF